MSAPLAHLVDDDDAMRDALAWLLRSRGIDSRAWNCAEAFLGDYRADMRGCLVLDIRMRAMTGLELFDHLLALDCAMPVIFLTGHGEVPQAVKSLKKGAFDFLEKPFDDNELADRVIEALTRDTDNRARGRIIDQTQKRLANLTQREQEVMKAILAGKMNKVIADELEIAMRTVEVHRAHVFEKMAVRSAVELTQLLAQLPR